MTLDLVGLADLARSCMQDEMHLACGEEMDYFAIACGPGRHKSKTIARFDGPHQSSTQAEQNAFAKFWGAASPAVVLALIAEVREVRTRLAEIHATERP